jgi:p-aminobenzoyl-glutamate transporter AbgT
MPGLLMGAKLFIPLWLLGAFVNLWIGVNSAGYSWSEELPIFIGIFALPAVVAGAVWWTSS